LNEKTTTFKSQPQYKRLYNINYLSPIAHYYDSSSYVSQVIKKGEKQELIKAVQKFDENIAATDIIVEDGSVSIYMMHKELGNVPITVFGDGLKKVFVLSNGLINSKDGIFLIDEVETAIHYSALIRIFKWLVKTCIKLRVQVFLTSHSLEVIDAIIEAVREELGEGYLEKGLRVITLNKEKEGEKIKVRNLNGIEASKAREDYGLELR
jgi:AAA15 family ATPase/GTPase